MLDKNHETEAVDLRKRGKLALRKAKVLPPSVAQRKGAAEASRQAVAEKKATAVAQILDAWGLLDDLSFDDQEQLVRDILDVTLLDGES